MSEADRPGERSPASRAAALRELAAVFLELGTIGFGGPAAHIALMEAEVVRRRGWLAREEFLDLLAATHLVPGPNSTEMAIHVGLRRAGVPGLLVAGACFILPATAIVTAVAWAYVRFGRLPEAAALLYGVKPVILAVIVQAIVGLGRNALRTRTLAALGAAALAASLLGANELLVLAVAGAAATAIRPSQPSRTERASAPAGTPLGGWIAGGAAAAGAASVPFGLAPLFLVFLKVGAVLFGSGYVLIAFLRADLVERLGWLTESQLLDAIAVGQLTPGPVFTTATFVGYLLAGVPGAAVATVGIFLPAFVFVALSGPLVPRLRRSRSAAAVLDGLVVASLAIMVSATAKLAGAAVVDLPSGAILAVAALLLLRWRVGPAWLVLGGALAGVALEGLR